MFVAFVMFFPVSPTHAPVVTLLIPTMRNPAISWPRCIPMPGNPLMPITCPVPEATDPDLAGNRWGSVVFDARRGRCHEHRFGIIGSMNGGRSDDTSGQPYQNKQRG